MIDREIRELIENAHVIGITSHIRPDGDAIGSVLGLGLALISSGKTVEMALHSGVSKTFRHLKGSELVKKNFTSLPDLYIVVDCSDLERTMGVLDGHQADIVVDHHVTNLNFGKVNLVEPTSVATCAILAEHMPKWGLQIDESVASALLSGIISDSIGFRTSNTTSQSLHTAADLIDKGADMNELYNRALLNRPFESAKYWGFGLAKLERTNGLVWTTLSLKDRLSAGYKDEDDADLTNILSSIEGIDIAILFIEQGAEKIKVSWRARPGLDVSGLALELGGGGHPAAAGVDLTGKLEEVQAMILKKTNEFLKQANNAEMAAIKSSEME